MRIAILATGNEVVLGDVLNTNTFNIAQILHSEGLSPSTHLACCDTLQEITDSLHVLASQHDLIITIGGLGPTSDDKTRFALSAFLNLPLIEYPEALEHIQKRLQGTNRILNEGNRQQTLFPQNSSLLPNSNGSAMGSYLEHEDKIFIMLPGPPSECLPMFNHFALPLLKSFKTDGMQFLKWQLFGVAEGQIAPVLDNAVADIPCETGFRWDPPYVEFKVRCTPDLVETINKRIDPLVASHIISDNHLKASQKLRLWLTNNKVNITIIDDATGGILQTLLQTPQNYTHLTFYDPKMPSEIRIHLYGLKEYWFQTQSPTSSVGITFKTNQKNHQENHDIHFYKTLAPLYAAEWACFRIQALLASSVDI